MAATGGPLPDLSRLSIGVDPPPPPGKSARQNPATQGTRPGRGYVKIADPIDPCPPPPEFCTKIPLLHVSYLDLLWAEEVLMRFRYGLSLFGEPNSFPYQQVKYLTEYQQRVNAGEDKDLIMPHIEPAHGELYRKQILGQTLLSPDPGAPDVLVVERITRLDHIESTAWMINTDCDGGAYAEYYCLVQLKWVFQMLSEMEPSAAEAFRVQSLIKGYCAAITRAFALLYQGQTFGGNTKAQTTWVEPALDAARIVREYTKVMLEQAKKLGATTLDEGYTMIGELVGCFGDDPELTAFERGSTNVGVSAALIQLITEVTGMRPDGYPFAPSDTDTEADKADLAALAQAKANRPKNEAGFEKLASEERKRTGETYTVQRSRSQPS